MPRGKNRTSGKSLDQTFLTIAVDDYKVRTSTGPNLQLLGTARYVSDDEEYANVSYTTLELSGLCIDLKERAGDHYEITLHGESSNTGILCLRIKDLDRRDKNGIHEYK